jgi:hypothetical protein
MSDQTGTIAMSPAAIGYLDQMMRYTLGRSPAFLGTAANPTLLQHLAVHLAECEEAKRILRSKGYGVPFSSFTELAALVPQAGDKPKRKHRSKQ